MKVKEFLKDYGRWVIALGFAIAVFCLWYIKYPHILSAREESTLFIWDWTYVEDRLAMPWGWAELTKSFIQQFFFNTFLGAVIIAALCLLVQGLTYRLLRLLVRKEQFAAVCFLLSFLPALYVCYLPLHPKGGTEEEIKYDYLVRKGDWPQIINQFHKERAESMACNGAAAVAMFKAGQIGQQELAHSIPMTKQALSGRAAAFIMSDLYITVGLISLSQRSAFEAMESIEDFNKSGRSRVRLTECSLIFGQPEVALKYIALLEKTVFYRRWAQQMRVLAEHPEQLENHPFYGNLRKMQEQSADTFFM